MSHKAPFISRKYPLGDWGNAKFEDDFFFDENTKEWDNESDKAMALLSELLSELLVWLSEGNMNSRGYKECIARKTIAFIWCMRPDLLDNQSLREIAKRRGVGFTPASISKHVAFFTEKFGRFHNGTKSEQAKQSYKESTTMYHKEKRRLRGIG